MADVQGRRMLVRRNGRMNVIDAPGEDYNASSTYPAVSHHLAESDRESARRRVHGVGVLGDQS